MASGQRELTRNQKTDAALHNEAVTRKRVEMIEAVLWPLDRDDPRTPPHSEIAVLWKRMPNREQLEERLRMQATFSNTHFERLNVLENTLLFSGFWGRLRWLFTGR